MNRRRLLVALGGLAGTAGALGTGAFTSVSATRDVSVAVADDTDALLALRPCGDSPNGAYAKTTPSGAMRVDLATAAGGEGVNADAVTVVDDVFEVVNQGTQPVGVWLDVDPVEDASGTDRVQFYRDGDRSTDVVGSDGAWCLGVGEKLCVGLAVDTHGIGSEPPENLLRDVANGHEMVVHASAGVGCGSVAGAPGAGVNTGPVAYYPFDGDATDATGNGFDGVLRGDASFTADSRIGTRAASLGGGGYVEVPDAPGLDVTGPYTETAWTYLNDTGGLNDVTMKDPAQWALGFQVRNGALRAGFENEDDDNFIGVGGSVPASTWTHLAVVYDGSSVVGYVDGTEVFDVDQASDSSGIAVADATPATNDEPLTIGAGEGQFDGRIDDLRIYDRALSASEIAALAGSP